jgi:hypothetical protein
LKKSISLLLLTAVVSLILGLTGCGGAVGTSSSATGGSGPAQTSFSISDTPPMGVTVLRFQIQIMAASMQPMGSGAAVSLLNSPAVVELTHLQSESALLANPSVAAATYTGLSATFANPQMTILNRSNTTYTVGGTACAPGAVCVVNPTLNQASVTDESAPFPLVVTSASPIAFVLHFDVNASVQGDLSVSPTINLKELPPLPSGALTQFHLAGRITAITSPSFTIQTGFGNQSISITTTSNTQYGFGATCGADDFACLLTGEVVIVGVIGMPGGTLDATNIQLAAPPNMPALQGTVIAVNAAQNQVQLALGDFQDDPMGHLVAASMTRGVAVTVNLSNSTTFSIDTTGITLPTLSPALSFASVKDFVVGQTVSVQPSVSSLAVVVGPQPPLQISFTASSVSLESSEVTATVASTNATAKPPSFTLNGLPPLFTGETPAVTEIVVDTATGTNFENGLSGVSGLSDGNTMSVGGLLFNTTSTPTLIAERVLVQ